MGMINRLAPIGAVSVAFAACALFAPVASAQRGQYPQQGSQPYSGPPLAGAPGSTTPAPPPAPPPPALSVPARPPSNITVSCGSGDYDYVECKLNGFPVIDARIAKRRSSASCDFNKDWGVRQGYVWVRNGCRADIELTSVRGGFGKRDGDMLAASGPAFPPGGRPDYDRDRSDRSYEARRDGDRDFDNDDRNWADRNWRDRLYRKSVEACSHEAVEEAWRRGFWSAQYEVDPRFSFEYRRFEVRGRVRLHGDRGFTLADTVCRVERDGDVQDFQMR